MQPKPFVSIGLPVYNAENIIARCIESLLNQTFKDFELIISDNCSSDATEAICKDYANIDSRIKYIRQPINVGMIPNFNLVLEQAQSKYFMWAAADDIRDHIFLEKAVQILKTNDDCVVVLSHFQIFDYKNNNIVNKITPSSYCHDLSFMRLNRVIEDLHPNLMYGLFKVSSNKSDFFLESIDWTDILWVARVVTRGKYYIIPEVLYTIGINGSKRRPYSLEGKYLTLSKFRKEYKKILKRCNPPFIFYLKQIIKLYTITNKSMKIVNKEILSTS